MADERHAIVAGAGIAGLTAALALARAGLHATVLEQTPELQEAGAGLQLGPNATKVLIALGLRDRLLPVALAPQAIRVMNGGSGREIVRIPLGTAIERRYGAPYWVIHRGDLQMALAAAAEADPDVELNLGVKVEDFATHVNGVSVLGRSDQGMIDERGIALIGADGIWSSVAEHLQLRDKPRYAHRTAWRTVVPADTVPDEFRTAFVHLWLGLDAHLVHYPVKGGRVINIVAIVHDQWQGKSWSAAGDRAEILRHFARFTWHERVRALIALPQHWLKWALYARRGVFQKGEGPVTLIGDAAHPMLPFLAQGAGMAIEDAAVVAAMLAKHRDDPAHVLRAYEDARRHRTARMQEASRKQGKIYAMSGPEALVRNLGMRLIGGEKLLLRQDWIYSWQPPAPFNDAPDMRMTT